MKNIFRISGVILFVLSIFLIHSCKKEKPTLPTVTTTSITAISYTTATSGGEVTNDGRDPIISKGICWHTSAEPTILNNRTSEGGGLGTFISNINQLAPNTLYYVKAYATNLSGTGYGNQVTFTTSQVAVPVLTTTEITSITQTTSVSGGNITTDNGGSVTARGVCWSTSQNPTIADSKTTDGTGTGAFTSSIIGLTTGATYYVKAYAANSAGIGYGAQQTFTTNPQILLTIKDATTWTLENWTLSTISNAIVKLYASQSSFNNKLPDFTTTSDLNGIAKLSDLPIQVQYFLIVEKGDLSNIKDGYVIEGVFGYVTDIDSHSIQTGAYIGGLKYLDWNWDGVINATDIVWHDEISIDVGQTTTKTIIIGK